MNEITFLVWRYWGSPRR